jgi:hypothetical protein
MVLAEVGVCQVRVKCTCEGNVSVESPSSSPTSFSPVAGSRSPNWNGVGGGVGVSVGEGVGASDGVAVRSGLASRVGDGVGASVGEEVGAELGNAEARASDEEGAALAGPGVGVELELVQLGRTNTSVAVIAASLRAWEGLIERVIIERLATPPVRAKAEHIDQVDAGRAGSVARAGLLADADLGLDLDRDPKGQLSQTHGRSGVGAGLSVELDDQVREAIDDRWLALEAGRRADHPEDAQPGRDPIEIAELALEAAQDRESDQPGRLIRLLHGHVVIDLAQWSGDAAVGVLWSVPADIGAVAR